MTALVLHGLVLMRDGGFDPAPAGLTCDPQREPFASACARLRATHGKVRSGDDILDAELAAACLRFAPEHEGTRAAVQYFVDAAAALPPGLLGRTGLALLAAHDRDRAQRCLALLQQNQAAGPLEPDAFPGEDPLAAQAMRLELVCALAPGDAGERDRLTFAVLQQCLAGAGSTYANGCALAALSLALPADVATPMTVVVRAGAVERSVELTAECSFTARMSLPFAATCTLTGPEDRRLLLQVVTERTERASDHAAWAMPLQVQRELCRRRPDATAEQRARGEDLLPLGAAPPRVGELLHLRVRVRSPVPMRYVVVECPLPANFEVPDPPWWIERFDDRLAFTFDRLPAGESTRTFAVVPTMVGTVVFPPAVAAPMYASGFDGGCAGSMVEVLAAPPAALIATAPCFNTPPPPPDPPPPLTAAQRVEDARAAIATAWDRQPPDDAASSSDIAAPLAELAQWAARGETETVLRAATSLVDNLLQGGTEDGASAWRVAVAARLRATEHDLMFTALGLLAKEAPGLPNPYLHEAILRAVVHLPQQVERESVQAQVLAALRSVDPRLLG
ncbi:MAG TPA: hypothetical protein VK348_11440, partial [Planctomycetota bacterium]|nr:hypothetical protein [Planctomycetota bacterium]